MAWLLKRGNVYYVGWRDGSKDRYESTKTSDENLAETKRIAKELAMRINFDGKASEPSPNMSLDALIELYQKQADISSKTVKINKTSWEHWRRVTGDKGIGAYTGQDGKKFKDTLIAESYAAASISLYIRDTKMLFGFAVEKGLIKASPVEDIRLPHAEEVYRFLTKEEEELLLSVANPLFKRVIPFALETGLRLSQIVHLNWKQFDHKERLLVVPGQKRQKTRRIPVFEKALAAMGTPKIAGQVFPITNEDQIKKMWSRLKDKAHIKGRMRFHDLRHTCASRLAEVLTPVELRDFFGWGSVQMCDRYMHSTTKSIRDKIARSQTVTR